jgi:serine/threonine protein phosphatase PrpC
MRFIVYQASRQGRRKHNEDRVAYSYSKNALLAVLADGMGGHSYGEVAAQFATSVLTDSFQRMALPILANPFKFLDEHIRQAHDAIEQHALLNDMRDTPCTTVVAAIIQHDVLYCAHVGDSRLYHFRNGQLLFRTEDHSSVQRLLRDGLIREDQVLTHPDRSKIYNCVGGSVSPRVQLAQKRQLQEGDAILLCTDGLWSLLDEKEIGEILQNGQVTDTVPVLLDLAEARADRNGDNISAIAFNWGVQQYNSRAISTASMPLDANTTIHDYQSSLNEQQDIDLELERALAATHAALAKNRE